MDKKEKYIQINESLKVICKWAKRGLIKGQIKEKYLTTRWYARFENLSLYKIFHPHDHFFKWPNWALKLEIISEIVFRYTGINWLFHKWQKYCYIQGNHEIIVKYPSIYHCIDWPELLDEELLDNYYILHSRMMEEE